MTATCLKRGGKGVTVRELMVNQGTHGGLVICPVFGHEICQELHGSTDVRGIFFRELMEFWGEVLAICGGPRDGAEIKHAILLAAELPNMVGSVGEV